MFYLNGPVSGSILVLRSVCSSNMRVSGLDLDVISTVSTCGACCTSGGHLCQVCRQDTYPKGSKRSIFEVSGSTKPHP